MKAFVLYWWNSKAHCALLVLYWWNSKADGAWVKRTCHFIVATFVPCYFHGWYVILTVSTQLWKCAGSTKYNKIVNYIFNTIP